MLDGPVGDLARSHGGHIELVDVRDGTVTVNLAGACHGCPAARTTLRQGLEDRLRRSHPQLRTVTAGQKVECESPSAHEIVKV